MSIGSINGPFLGPNSNPLFVPPMSVDLHALYTQVPTIEMIKYVKECDLETLNHKKEGEFLLHRAVRDGRIDLVQALLEKGAEPFLVEEKGGHCLHDCAQMVLLDLLRLLLQLPHAKHHINDARNGTLHNACATPLHIAAAEGHQEVVKVLLEAGADIDAKTKDGDSPLSIASQNGQTEVVKLLLDWMKDSGMDVVAKLNERIPPGLWTPLLAAAAEGHQEVVKVLLEAGADIDAQNKDGDSALYIASQNGQKEIVEILLGEGADFFTNSLEQLASLLKYLLPKCNSDNKRIIEIIEIILSWHERQVEAACRLASQELNDNDKGSLLCILRCLTHQNFLKLHLKNTAFEARIRNASAVSLVHIISSVHLFNAIRKHFESFEKSLKDMKTESEVKAAIVMIETMKAHLQEINAHLKETLLPDIRGQFFAILQPIIEKYQRVRHECVEKLNPKTLQQKFDEEDVFCLLLAWKIGVGQSLGDVQVSPETVFKNQLGCNYTEFCKLGIFEGGDLRVIGIDNDLLLLIEEATLKRDDAAYWPAVADQLKLKREKVQELIRQNQNVERAESLVKKIENCESAIKTGSPIISKSEFCNTLAELDCNYSIVILSTFISYQAKKTTQALKDANVTTLSQLARIPKRGLSTQPADNSAAKKSRPGP